MKISLTALERTARAADKDNPGVCFQADHVDGYPTADSAMAYFNAFDPATAMSLIRRIRELEALAGRAINKWAELDREFDLQLGGGPDGEIADARAVLEAGTTRYGRYPVGYDDHWDIDRIAGDDTQVDANAAPISVPRDAHPLLHSLAHDIENLDGEIARLTATRARIEAELRARLRESGTAVSATIGAPDVKPAALSPRLTAVETERIRLCINVAESEGVIEEGEQASLKVAVDRVTTLTRSARRTSPPVGSARRTS